jgi:hypothetical protein
MLKSKEPVGLYEYMCSDHITLSVFITFLELLALVIFWNTGLICTHGRTGVRLVTPLRSMYKDVFERNLLCLT